MDLLFFMCHNSVVLFVIIVVQKGRKREPQMLLYLALIDTEEEKRKFVSLYENYRQTMYYAAYQILKNTHAAEDAVHQAFLRVINHLEQIDEADTSRTKGFLVVITQHIAIDDYRRRKREQLTNFTDESPFAASVPDPVAVCADTDMVVQALLQLPVDDSTILCLKYAHGYSGAEIAAILNIREDAVRKRISRAKKRLAKILEEGDDMS